MHALTAKTMAVMTGFAAFGTDAAGAGPGSPRPPQPVIMSMAADFKDNTMMISGQHFGNATPVVRPANQVLPVKSFTKDPVIVSLSLDVRPATYGLTITTTKPARISSEAFSAALAPPILSVFQRSTVITED